MDLLIKKRDGESEYFNFDKLLASIGRAGVPVNKAINIAKNVEDWVASQKDKGEVTSTQIRNKVIEYMIEDFPAEADSYKAYK